MKSNTAVVTLLIIVAALCGYILFYAPRSPKGDVSGSSDSFSSPKRDGSGSRDTFNILTVDACKTPSRARSTYMDKKIYSTMRTTTKDVAQKLKNSTFGPIICERWAVVTTVNAPTQAVQRQAHLRGLDTEGGRGRWCVVVVADTGGLERYALETPLRNFVYLSEQDQRSWASGATAGGSTAQSEFLKALPWGHVGRKNAGYLYAILHGAKYIWDFDDDVMIMSKHATIPTPGEAPAGAGTLRTSPDYEARVPSAPYASEAFNPFPLFEANHNPSWPRGFPPDRILRDSSSQETPLETTVARVPASSVAVVQFLANHDPDVDCLYRMIRPLPLDFPIHGQLPLILPSRDGVARSARTLSADPSTTTGAGSAAASAGATTTAAVAAAPAVAGQRVGPEVPPAEGLVFAPYNAQSTLHTGAALWALLLPLGPHPRVSDIWRSYIAQRLFADIGVRVAFHSPIVTHMRKAKEDNIPDLHHELPLFTDTLDLLRTLRAWKGAAATLPGRLEELYIALYEEGFLSLQDVRLAQLWLGALRDAGYVFPELRRR